MTFLRIMFRHDLESDTSRTSGPIEVNGRNLCSMTTEEVESTHGNHQHGSDDEGSRRGGGCNRDSSKSDKKRPWVSLSPQCSNNVPAHAAAGESVAWGDERQCSGDMAAHAAAVDGDGGDKIISASSEPAASYLDLPGCRNSKLLRVSDAEASAAVTDAAPSSSLNASNAAMAAPPSASEGNAASCRPTSESPWVAPDQHPLILPGRSASSYAGQDLDLKPCMLQQQRGSMGGPGRPSRDLEVVLRLEDLPSPSGGGAWDTSFCQLVMGMTSFDLMVGILGGHLQPSTSDLQFPTSNFQPSTTTSNLHQVLHKEYCQRLAMLFHIGVSPSSFPSPERQHQINSMQVCAVLPTPDYI